MAVKQVHILRTLWIFIVLVVVLASGLREWTAYLTFKFNQSTIENTHCINKKKPSLKCKGKCFLKKQLKEAEESREGPHFVYNPDAPFNLFLSVNEEFWLSSPAVISNNNFSYTNLPGKPFILQQFQPPEEMI